VEVQESHFEGPQLDIHNFFSACNPLLIRISAKTKKCRSAYQNHISPPLLDTLYKSREEESMQDIHTIKRGEHAGYTYSYIQSREKESVQDIHTIKRGGEHARCTYDQERRRACRIYVCTYN
jgi:hypothetical protein